MKIIILVLGAPNDAAGNLSTIAQDRLTCAYHVYRANDVAGIICTGGFGPHFNTTDKPHSYYARQFLLHKGVADASLLESPLSANTVADFYLAKAIIQEQRADLLIVVTSDFHMKRAKFICQQLIKYPKALFVEAMSSMAKADLDILEKHEIAALQDLEKNGIRPPF